MSLYWDDFERRIAETVEALKSGKDPIVRRVAVFITNKCNFRCKYCKVKFGDEEMSKEAFNQIVKNYRGKAIIHITGGEPSVVDWLYGYMDHQEAKFHLNTNAYIKPPRNVRRLKISLDSYREEYINNLVGVKDAFTRIIENIKYACDYTITSITCVVSRENYLDLPQFVDFCNSQFPKLYAVFFSVYKGINPRFVMGDKEVSLFFNKIIPEVKKRLSQESLWLLNETIDEKRRILQGTRFPENNISQRCFLSLSERVFDCQGREYRCSHLFRDRVLSNDSLKTEECKYGCNRKLVRFNQEVEELLKEATV
jgi:sulfatase maturation enzyme AslB (radical SAM superfamily)